ncbi:MAG: Rpn family recombination-promoting nuclease/putative transposase [Enterococcus sp.]|nr:Rpn family recombination-promoting nuclease/putative transposase [Enterococcus sp.]
MNTMNRISLNNRDYIDFTNDSMFAYVMHDKKICKGMLQAILPHLQIKDIKFQDQGDSKSANETSVSHEVEKSLQAAFGKRGVRLDAYLEDEDTVYNIEMQKLDYGDLPMRSRLYQAQVDVLQLDPGQSLDCLKPVFIIFICMFDPFNAGRVMYTSKHFCEEDINVDVFDGVTKVFINANGGIGEVSPDLTEVLKYISKAKNYEVSEDSCDLVKSISFAVEKANLDRKWVVGVKTFQTELLDRERYGLKRGIEQGIQQGLQQGLKQGISKGVQKGASQANKSAAKNLSNNGVNISTIAKSLNQSETTIREWLAE